MRFLLVLVGAIAFFALIPFIRCFIKRLKCAVKLKGLCRRRGYQIYPTHPLWFFGSKHGRRCDLYVETPNEVFAIKLFGIPRRLTVLVMREDGKYFIRRYLAFLSNNGLGIRFPINGKAKPMPAYDFRYRYRDEWEIKTPRHILLVNPIPMEFLRQPQNGRETSVGAGELVYGMEIDSLPRLLADLESVL